MKLQKLKIVGGEVNVRQDGARLYSARVSVYGITIDVGVTRVLDGRTGVLVPVGVKLGRELCSRLVKIAESRFREAGLGGGARIIC